MTDASRLASAGALDGDIFDDGFGEEWSQRGEASGGDRRADRKTLRGAETAGSATEGASVNVVRLRRDHGLRETVERARWHHKGWRNRVSKWCARLDLAPDLAQDIGSLRWFRGLATMLALGAVAISFWPSFSPLQAAPAMTEPSTARDGYRSQMILPLGLGADSGAHMGPGPLVKPLATIPERPRVELEVRLASGSRLTQTLARAGVGSADRARAETLISQAIALDELAPQTRLDLVLGRRDNRAQPRPLESLSFRARFDLALEIERQGGELVLLRKPILVDDTPLRIRGKVGQSLYRSARAAGAPASAVQEYLRVLDQHLDIDRALRASDEYDLIIAYRRAETGERQAGKLLYAGVERSGRPRVQLMRWGRDGRFYEASGVGEQRSGMVAPVPGKITSRFGMRRHPILGYRRMHSGIDFRARYGTPVVAVNDGRISGAGRAGGCGKAVRIAHGAGLSTRYCHLSRIAVRQGQKVRRGQVIGYVGSTGLSTGPHLHYEMYRNGRAINPASVKFVRRAQLSGSELARFKQQLARLKQVKVGAALSAIEPRHQEPSAPQREIDKVERKATIG